MICRVQQFGGHTFLHASDTASRQVDSSEQLRTTVRFLLMLAPVLRALFRGASEADRPSPSLTPRQMQALCVLYLEPNLTVSQLASWLGMSLAGASQLVAQLAGVGVVRREEDPLDHRRTVVTPGPRFAEIFEQQVGVRLGPLQQALAHLGEEERVGLLHALDTLSNLVSTAPQEHPVVHGCCREQAEGRIKQ